MTNTLKLILLLIFTGACAKQGTFATSRDAFISPSPDQIGTIDIPIKKQSSPSNENEKTEIQMAFEKYFKDKKSVHFLIDILLSVESLEEIDSKEQMLEQSKYLVVSNILEVKRIKEAYLRMIPKQKSIPLKEEFEFTLLSKLFDLETNLKIQIEDQVANQNPWYLSMFGVDTQIDDEIEDIITLADAARFKYLSRKIELRNIKNTVIESLAPPKVRNPKLSK